MDLSFLSPLGALAALAAALPLGALVLFERRAGRLRARLRLPEPPPRVHAPVAGALVALGLLLALAATQPVLATTKPRQVRSDAQAYVVLDVSQSMQASLGPREPTRLERAKQLAIAVRRKLTHVPFGVVSFTDHALPHLFPTADETVFASVLRESVAINEPPPPDIFTPVERVTDLSAIAEMGSSGFFRPDVKRRLVIVLSDDESNTVFPANIAAAFRRRPRIDAIFVHVWDERERIYLPGGRVDPNYRPDPRSVDLVRSLASGTKGRSFAETDVNGIVGAARDDLGRGQTKARGEERSRSPLAPWLVLAGTVPLATVLRRRNF